MKKLFVLLLALVMLAMGAFLIACDEETPDNNDDGNTEQGGENNQGDETENGGAPATYTATFKADGVVVETVSFTAADATISTPAVPSKTGYSGAWEQFTLPAQNITVNAVYTPITYTATFKADGNTVATRQFTVENKNISVPSVPEKTGYAGMWESYTLGASNITINAVYTAGDYFVTFKANGVEIGKVAFTVEDTEITEPSVPFKQCYTGKWENYTLGAQNITVNAVYTVAHTNLKRVARAEPQCNKTGNKEYWSCTSCNKYFSNSAGTSEITNKSSVTLAKVACSYVDCVCRWCGDKNHGLTRHARVEPQCNKTGNIEYWSCSKCNKNFTDVNANNVTTTTVLSKVACSYVDCICKWCGDKTHSLTHHARAEAKCNATGNIEYWSCSKCNKNFTDANANNTTNNISIDTVSCVYVNELCKWCSEKKPSEGLEYVLLEGGESYMVSLGTCTDADVIIPSKYNGKPVTYIAEAAFSGYTLMTSVTIPNSITNIGEAAFYNCTGLTSITVPDSVTSISYAAFCGCSSLKSLTLPFVGDSVKTVNDRYQYPFGYIFGSSIYNGGLATRQSYYGSSVSSTYSTYYIPASLKSVTITGGNILYGAFYNCTSLASVTMGNSIESIGEMAFYNCTGLTSVIIPDSVTSIGDSAFGGCTGLKSITIPFIGASKYAKGYQSHLGYIFGYFSSSSSENHYHYYSGYYYTYYIPTSLETVILSNAVTSIGSYAFSGCGGLAIRYRGSPSQWDAIVSSHTFYTEITYYYKGE